MHADRLCFSKASAFVTTTNREIGVRSTETPSRVLCHWQPLLNSVVEVGCVSFPLYREEMNNPGQTPLGAMRSPVRSNRPIPEENKDDRPFREIVDAIGNKLTECSDNHLFVHIDATGENYRTTFFEGVSLVFSMIDHSDKLASVPKAWWIWRENNTVLAVARINAPGKEPGTRDLKTLVMYMNPRRANPQVRGLLACYITLALFCRDNIEYSLERAESLVTQWMAKSPVHVVIFRDLRETSRAYVRWVNKENCTHSAVSTFEEAPFSRKAVELYAQVVEPAIIDEAATPEEYDAFSNDLFKSTLKLPNVSPDESCLIESSRAMYGVGAGGGAGAGIGVGAEVGAGAGAGAGAETGAETGAESSVPTRETQAEALRRRDGLGAPCWGRLATWFAWGH